jgi:hypothetical protein
LEIGDTGIAGENVYVESFDVDLTPDQLFTMFIDVVFGDRRKNTSDDNEHCDENSHCNSGYFKNFHG